MLPKKHRLNSSQISFIKRKGASLHTAHFKIRHYINKTDSNRFCIIVSKKTSKKATDRNKLRRQISAAIQQPLREDSISLPAFDCIILLKSSNKTPSFEEIKSGVLETLKRLKSHYEKL